jgi:hypothetical protein
LYQRLVVSAGAACCSGTAALTIVRTMMIVSTSKTRIATNEFIGVGSVSQA